MKGGKKEFYFTQDEWDDVNGYIDAVGDAVDDLSRALNKATVAVQLPELEEDDDERTFGMRAKDFELTLADWQLFRNDPLSEAAVVVLNAALKSICLVEDEAYKARDMMYGIMDHYVEQGARDTEPEVCLVAALQAIYDTDNLTR